MSNNTEDIHLRLENFMKEHEKEFDSRQALVDAFIAQYHDSLEEGASDFMADERVSALEWFQDARQTDDPSQALSKMKQALTLDPSNLEIKLAIYQAEDKAHAYIPKLEEDLANYYQENRRQLEDGGYAKVANRPYLRSLAFLADYYAENLRYDQAIQLYKKLLKLDDRDTLEARYHLLGAYINSFNFRRARAHFKKYDRQQEDIRMMGMMIVSAWLEEDEAWAMKLTARVLALNPDSRKLFEAEALDLDLLSDLADAEDAASNRSAALASGLREVDALIERSEALYAFIKGAIEEIIEPTPDSEDAVDAEHAADAEDGPAQKVDSSDEKSQKTDQEKNKQSSKADSSDEKSQKTDQEKNKQSTKGDSSAKEAKKRQAAKDRKDDKDPKASTKEKDAAGEASKIFQEIGQQYIDLLVEEGYEQAADFKKATQADILEIDGVGQATLDKLIANGVEFKEQE